MTNNLDKHILSKGDIDMFEYLKKSKFNNIKIFMREINNRYSIKR